MSGEASNIGCGHTSLLAIFFVARDKGVALASSLMWASMPSSALACSIARSRSTIVSDMAWILSNGERAWMEATASATLLHVDRQVPLPSLPGWRNGRRGGLKIH